MMRREAASPTAPSVAAARLPPEIQKGVKAIAEKMAPLLKALEAY